MSLEVKEFTQPKEAGADFVKSDFTLKYIIKQVKIGRKNNQRKQVQIWLNQISDKNLKKVKFGSLNNKSKRRKKCFS